MSAQNPHGIGPAGRWYIFCGIPFAVIAVYHTALSASIERLVGEKASPYADLFIIGAIAVGALALYDHVPQRWVFPLGIGGWIISFSLLYWYFWFGLGAFGHHHGF